jgi:mannitol-1-phosphate/altronate dehydrogenase
MTPRVFVGFGFGAIQSGLFLDEAFRSGRFTRLVVAEVMNDVVAAVRADKGVYTVNVATRTGIERHVVKGVEIFNPNQPADRAALIEAVARASELATALPSVKFFESGGDASVAGVLAEGIRRKIADPALPAAVVYTAENNNHAAEILHECLGRKLGADLAKADARCQLLNTVIGKMSGVVTDPAQIKEQDLAPATSAATRAFLVEAFNRILITRITLTGFTRGISVFEEKDDLFPFEEAKLYGHNATHALIGYLGWLKGLPTMADAGSDAAILAAARRAFMEESGRALQVKYKGLDPLFTAAGWKAYVEDLLVRMANPHLRDAVDRIIRDPRRKLGWHDRLVGTMRLARAYGFEAGGYARGAAAAVRLLKTEEALPTKELLESVWKESSPDPAEAAAVLALIEAADKTLG